MADSAAGAASSSLAQFLDTLPRTPCDVTPQNRYYCTICERLNKGVAARCKYSDLESDKEIGTHKIEGSDKSVGYTGIAADSGVAEKARESSDGPDTGGVLKKDSDSSERVEFKVVAPADADEEYPLIELIPPKDKRIKPIEMELLQNIALEFEVSDDEPVEVEALEVEPLDDDYEESENDDAVEVDAFEVEALEDIDLSEFDDNNKNSLPQFTPIQQPKQLETPDQGSGKRIKMKPKRGGKKRMPKGLKKVDQQQSFPFLTQTPGHTRVPSTSSASVQPTLAPQRPPPVPPKARPHPITQTQPQATNIKSPPLQLQPMAGDQTGKSTRTPKHKPKMVRKVKK
jgi:hypothetical protein